MATLDARRSRSSRPGLFEEPLLLRRTRRDMAELIGCIWLAFEFARVVRSRFAHPRAVR
jgi:hypothetical protein